ncbi:MAG: hypothetical protein V1644_02915 [Candidatus Micrarchaeota archaeon]
MQKSSAGRISLKEAGRIAHYPIGRFLNNLSLGREVGLRKDGGRYTIDRHKLDQHVAQQRKFAHAVAVPNSEYLTCREASKLTGTRNPSNLAERLAPYARRIRMFTLHQPSSRPMRYFHAGDLKAIFIEPKEKRAREEKEDREKLGQLRERHVELVKLMTQLEQLHQQGEFDATLQARIATGIRENEKTARTLPEAELTLPPIYRLSRRYDKIVAARTLANVKTWLREKEIKKR